MSDTTFDIERQDFPLDLFSTSPTLYQDLCCPIPAARCTFGAPFFAFKREGGRYGVVQGCCNHWECPRCGVLVAKKHYGRIVEGAREIAKTNELWFITITCRGKDLSEDEATKNYLAWTSRFLDAAYAKSKRAGAAWFYVQVTEKQKRGHPHSHILTTFNPSDVVEGKKTNWRTDNAGSVVREELPALRSTWLQAAVVSAGLGDQYDISQVRSVEGAARYVAKYMFKDSQFGAHFPKRWKRVRYSQSWPDFTKPKTEAFVLLSRADWYRLASLALVVDATSGDAYDTAAFFMRHDDVILIERKEQNERDDHKEI